MQEKKIPNINLNKLFGLLKEKSDGPLLIRFTQNICFFVQIYIRISFLGQNFSFLVYKIRPFLFKNFFKKANEP